LTAPSPARARAKGAPPAIAILPTEEGRLAAASAVVERQHAVLATALETYQREALAAHARLQPALAAYNKALAALDATRDGILRRLSDEFMRGDADWRLSTPGLKADDFLRDWHGLDLDPVEIDPPDPPYDIDWARHVKDLKILKRRSGA
jgi:hypothetical protein